MKLNGQERKVDKNLVRGHQLKNQMSYTSFVNFSQTINRRVMGANKLFS